ncbi:MAG: hypothetical protein LBB56_05185 [Chitinispirillales bacterium]|jgi:hypothetical protein|nr:hypothetical protein [Chitinispirillales bacterium]
MREEWGCEDRAPAAVWEEPELGEFFNCPLKFISETVVDWYEEYSYYQDFAGAAPAFLKQSAKFIEAARIYKTALNEYMAKSSKKKGNKPDGLQILRERFNGGNSKHGSGSAY